MAGIAWTSPGMLLVILVALLAVLAQIPVDHDILLVEKVAALPATRPTAFKYIANMQNFPEWFPGLESFEPVDSSPMGIGKHFTELQYLTLYGDLVYDNMITGYESPHFISFISNTWLIHRVEMVLERREDKTARYPTQFTWKLYSRRRNLLFKYLVCPVAAFVYYDPRVRQALFTLRYHFE